jgi:hypothetical protein
MAFIAHALWEAIVPNSGQYPELSALAAETVETPKLKATKTATNLETVLTLFFH